MVMFLSYIHTCTYILTHTNPHPQEIAIMGDTQALGTMSEKEDS